eukprot:gnl/TRDRNA2_/TRDRNA2_164814_c1_seq1.p1 gnl/TRDRNA2_/TRDRNA2_164814_c1~~gnl/TRDRNA2_/TRDRNA2_164814_c1_seq1.p1  ORF type:complete len:101 (+),score=15.55 gnl/TRDRNA2_/TRDRNA2_164814_c1_seq1:173-475(+)
MAHVAGPALRARDLWLQGFHCDPLRPVIRVDDDAAGFDFRRWASACIPPDGTEPTWSSLTAVAAEARELLSRDGAVEVPRDGFGMPPETFAYSLWTYDQH